MSAEFASGIAGGVLLTSTFNYLWGHKEQLACGIIDSYVELRWFVRSMWAEEAEDAGIAGTGGVGAVAGAEATGGVGAEAVVSECDVNGNPITKYTVNGEAYIFHGTASDLPVFKEHEQDVIDDIIIKWRHGGDDEDMCSTALDIRDTIAKYAGPACDFHGNMVPLSHIVSTLDIEEGLITKIIINTESLKEYILV